MNACWNLIADICELVFLVYSDVAVEECPLKEKKVEDVEKEEVKDEKSEDKKIENGDVKEKNGKEDAEEEKGIFFQFLYGIIKWQSIHIYSKNWCQLNKNKRWIYIFF